MNPRIVCAANRCKVTDQIIIGIRHYDTLMLQAKDDAKSFAKVESWPEPFRHDATEQGFVDQFGKFYIRTEAWKIAEANGQILRRVGGDSTNGGTLYSENLY